MRSGLLWRGLLIGGLAALSVWAAWPLREKINLGLDLQGGIHLVLRVQTQDAVRAETDKDMEVLRRQVAETQAEREAWRASAEEALAGLASAIDRQLDRWGLTPAEREVVSLVLRGRSHKQIASDTGRSERTVRQHAASAYRKAGLGSRAELAAYFLMDLPLPAGRPGEDRS